MTHTLTTDTKTDAVGFSTVPPLRMDSSAPGVDLPESSPAAPAATQTPPVPCPSDVSIHGYSGFAAGCRCTTCGMAKDLLTSTPPPTPVRVTGDELLLRAYVTYHSCLPPALAYWAVPWARDLTVSRLRLLGGRWSAMTGKDSTRTDGDASKPRRTDLDQPDPGGSRDSATDR